MCGCGAKTPIARKTAVINGVYRGWPLRYRHGHNRRGGEFTESHRAKISRANGGVPKSAKHRAALANALIRNPKITGPANVNWKGGSDRTADVLRSIGWARAVKRRDGRKCQQCGSRKTLHAHHILGWAEFPDKRFDLGNGVTLCRACHLATHRQTPDRRLASAS